MVRTIALIALARVALGGPLPSDHHQVRWVKNFDNLAHLSHEASSLHPVVFLFSDPDVPVEQSSFELDILKVVARDKEAEGALFAVTNNVTVTKEFWPSGLPDPPRLIVLRAFEEEQRLEVPWKMFQKPTGTAAQVVTWINDNAFHRFHEVTEHNVDLLHKREPRIKCVWYGPTDSRHFKTVTTDAMRAMADKYQGKIMFMYVDENEEELIKQAGGPVTEKMPAMRMFTSAADGAIGEILKSHPEGEESRQEVLASREMVHPDYAPKFIGEFVEESYLKLSGTANSKTELRL